MPASHYALFVTGPPASGKSSIAESIAQALPGFTLLQKDPLKEELYDDMPDNARKADAASRRLSNTALRVLWGHAANYPRVIVEANFRTLDPQERGRFQSLDANKLEVHCSCPFEVAMQRFASRAAKRHPAHTVHDLSREIFQESQSPFRLSPVIEIDTTSPIDMTSLIRKICTYWPEV